MKMNSLKMLLAGLLLLAAGGSLSAEPAPATLKLPAIISDNMVLQAGKPAPVWGWDVPGQAVKVKIAGQEKEATSDASGKWKVVLDPLEAGASLEMVVEGSKSLTVKNVLAGEVWLCSGQSNMIVTLQESSGGAAEAQASADSKLRFFTTGFHAPDAPAEDVTGRWRECSPDTARGFSAVAYYFGKRLRKDLDLPVGLILSAQGATAIESWMGREALQSDPDFKPILDKRAASIIDPKGWDMHLPSGLYHGRVLPLAPIALRGIIWYQGETNGSRAAQYRKLFPALIADWRKAWGEDLPFYFVQLANHFKPQAEPVNEAWAELREAQTLALKLPNTGMAVAIDVGEEKNIHPVEKKTVGDRLAALALSRTYDKKTVDSGPLYKSMKVEGNKIRISFDSVGSGLEAKGGPLKRFAIAGADQKFVWAEAEIDGNDVLVSSPQISEPVAVRYAWANNPLGCNLYNKDGFPASPFRTDDWPGITEGKHLWAAPPAAPQPPMDPPVPESAALTGNTLEVDLGKTIDRGWNQVRANGYRYGPRQKKDGKELRIWLPYEKERGLYYELEGFELESTRHDNPAALVYRGGGKEGKLTLKFQFSGPISAFRLSAGPMDFQANGAVAGFEYSTDGKEWKPLQQSSGGRVDRWLDPKQVKVDGLNTRELFLRCYLRGAGGSSQVPESTRLQARMAGDVRWGDASQTFAAAQWQLLVTPAEP